MASDKAQATDSQKKVEPVVAVDIKGEDRKVFTKAELESFVADIARRVVDSNSAYLHSFLALNQLLRQPEMASILDDELREQMRDIWVKLMKSTGLQMENPPILFGVRDGLVQWDQERVDGRDDLN